MTAVHQQDYYAPAAGRVCDPRSWLVDDRGLLSLNGEWGFRFAPVDPAHLLGPGEEAPCPATPEGETIDVPSHWVLRGEGRWGAPCYTNVAFPFPVHPPLPPDANPTGDYSRVFKLPDSWDPSSGQVRIRFDGVESMLRLWINGSWAGMATGSRLAHEFDITGLVRPEDNEVLVRVNQFSSGSYLEDQDQWWLPGIFRDVEVRYLRYGDIEDLWIDSDYDAERGAGSLAIEFRVLDPPGAPPASTLEIRVRLDEGGEERLIARRGEDGRYRAPVMNVGPVTPWTPENPRRIEVRVALASSAHGWRRILTGFRRIEIVDGRLCANGRPLVLNGVNRHEIRADEGRVFDESFARADLGLMKRLGVNAIRTSHYPPHPRLLDLADEIGLWVMLEGDVETHGFEDGGRWTGNPSADPRWRGAFLDRTARAFERDKNHPSVFCWSLGNESGTGENLRAASAWIKSRTGGRALVHYEGDHALEYSDIYSRMYPTLEEVDAVLDDSDPCAPLAVPGHSAGEVGPDARERIRRAPYLMCEYLHAMGTGPGGAAEYAARMAHPRHAGGFVWEWRDHALWQNGPRGRRLAYGGDFGEELHDGNFVCDGLVSAISEVYAGTYAWARAMSPDAPVFADESGAPGARTPSDPGSRGFAPPGPGADEAELRGLKRTLREPGVGSEEGGILGLDDFGRLHSVGGFALGPLDISVFRAPTDNDRGRGPIDYWGLRPGGEGELGAGLNAPGVSHAQRWYDAGLHLLRRRLLSHEECGGGAHAVREHWAPPSVRFGLIADIVYAPVLIGPADSPRAGVRIRLHVEPFGPWPARIPRLGVRFALEGTAWSASWVGERSVAYADMPGASPGVFSQAPVAGLWDRSVKPQEGGHRPGLVALRMDRAPDPRASADPSGSDRVGPSRIEIIPLAEMGWSACEWDERELAGAGHWEDLPPSERTLVWLDAYQDGIGTRSCGPDARPEYCAMMGERTLEWVLAPS